MKELTIFAVIKRLSRYFHFCKLFKPTIKSDSSGYNLLVTAANLILSIFGVTLLTAKGRTALLFSLK
jgi:hypothetical protein